MNNVLKAFANPIFVGLLAFIWSTPIIADDQSSIGYIEALIFLFFLYPLPFIILSLYTRKLINNRTKHIPLVVSWFGAILSTIIWTIVVYNTNDAQAGIGFLYTPFIMALLAFAGYF